MTEATYRLKKVTTGQEVPIASEMSVGRSEDCALRLLEGKASRHHAKIIPDPTGVFVEDLGSTNGTFVNGRRLHANNKLKLNAGDRLRFDIEEFVFVAPAAAASPDPDKTQYRPAQEAQPVTVKAASANKPEPGGQALPGSFADPKGTETVWVPPTGDSSQAASGAPMPAHAAGDAPYFWIESGKEAGRKIELKSADPDKGTWRIGSGDGSDVHFDDAGVSGKHAALRHDDATWLLTDDLSVNGTFVNDKKVLKCYLTSGDRVRFGPVVCRFYVPPPKARDRTKGSWRLSKYGLIAALAFALTLVLLWLATRFMS